MSAVVPPSKTCRACGAAGQRFLKKCSRCGRRYWSPFGSGVPGARY